MSFSILYTEQAKRDVRNIYEYIAFSLCEPETAAGMYRRIIDTINSLDNMPERCPLYRDEPWHSRGLREMIVKNYIALYLVDKENRTVTVVRVLYGRRDISKQLDDTL